MPAGADGVPTALRKAVFANTDAPSVLANTTIALADAAPARAEVPSVLLEMAAARPKAHKIKKRKTPGAAEPHRGLVLTNSISERRDRAARAGAFDLHFAQANGRVRVFRRNRLG